MPTIQMLFDDSVVKKKEILKLGSFLRELCLNTKHLNVKFAFAYGENPKIKVGMYPIEVYVKITRSKIIDENALLTEIEMGLKEWKSRENFKHPINILFMPMDWKVLDSI